MTDQFVYGVHAVAALLANPHRPTKKLYVNEERIDNRLQSILQSATEHQIPVERLSAQKMNQRFADVVHQGVVASAGKLPEYVEADLSRLLESSRQPSLILILDGVIFR